MAHVEIRFVWAILLLLSWTATFALGDASDHVDWLAIGEEWHHGRPGESLSYRFGAGAGCDNSTVVGGTLETPNGNVFPLVYDPDEPEWGHDAEYATPGGLDAYGDGNYVFTLNYVGGAPTRQRSSLAFPARPIPFHSQHWNPS